MSVSSRDLLLGLLVMLVWAGNAVALKLITFEVDPFTGLVMRFVVACVFFAPFFRWLGRAQFLVLLQVCVCMAVLHWGALIWAIDRLDASMATILMQLQLIFSVLIGRFFFSEKFGWHTGAGIFLGVCGIAVLVGLPEEPPSIAGVLGMAFSTFFLAVSYARMKAMRGVSSLNYVAHLHVIGILPAIVLMFVFENPQSINWGEINILPLLFAILYQALLMSGSHMLWQRLIARNAMSVLPNLTLLLPVFGVAMAVVFLGEALMPEMLFGGTLTTAGVGIIMWRKRVRAV